MGYYIQTGTFTGKAAALVAQFGAEVQPSVPDFQAAETADKAIVCVVDNGLFEAAGLAFSERELEEFSQPDGRRRTWLLMDRDAAYEAAGYTPTPKQEV